MTHPTVRLATITLTLAATALTACTNAEAHPTNTGTITPATIHDTPTTSTPPHPTTSTAPITPEEQAYLDAEKVYRAWTANYATAARTLDPTKLDKKLITPEMVIALTRDFTTMKTAHPKTQAIFTQDIKQIDGVRYSPKELALQVCATTNSRFIENGKDVTTTPDGKPSPVDTQPRAGQAVLLAQDGRWRVAAFVRGGGGGMPCAA